MLRKWATWSGVVAVVQADPSLARLSRNDVTMPMGFPSVGPIRFLEARDCERPVREIGGLADEPVVVHKLDDQGHVECRGDLQQGVDTFFIK